MKVYIKNILMDVLLVLIAGALGFLICWLIIGGNVGGVMVESPVNGITSFDRLGNMYSLNSVKMSDLTDNGDFSHDLSEDCDFSCRVGRLQKIDGRLGENLYKGGSCDIRTAIRLWEESPEHNEILESNYDHAVLTVAPFPEDTTEETKSGCYMILTVNQKR
jgi:hypothetical protein